MIDGNNQIRLDDQHHTSADSVLMMLENLFAYARSPIAHTDRRQRRAIVDTNPESLVASGLFRRELDEPNVSFRLTEIGERICGRLLQTFLMELGTLSANRPEWNQAERVLSYRGRVVKRFRKPAPNQELVLNRFEAFGWLNRISDPLPTCSSIVPAERLRETIKRLNGSLNTPLIRFRADGTGRGVCWHPTE